jgi:hypothetical protein
VGEDAVTDQDKAKLSELIDEYGSLLRQEGILDGQSGGSWPDSLVLALARKALDDFIKAL